MNESVAVYPGSFDPLTVGHDDIIRRGLRLFDRVLVSVAHTATQPKSGLFSIEERVGMITEVYADEPGVEAVAFSGLLVDFARDRGARVIIRGLRAVSDFEYEFQMALMNRSLWPEIEVLFMAPDASHTFLSSSLVRQVGRLGGDVSEFVHPSVLARMEERFREQ
jgi:pantetheine-phosphate adenylyltransferase